MEQEIKIEVAGLCVLLTINPARLVSRIHKDYCAFFSNKKPVLHIDITAVGKACNNKRRRRPGLAVSGDEIILIDDNLYSKIDLAGGRGVAVLNPAGFMIGMDTLLRNVFTFILLLKYNGLALHAAGILRDGMAYIFAGPSGSGKSTAAKLSEPYTVLNDDLVMIRPVNGSYCLFPTPAWLHAQSGPIENRPYPIGGIFKLVKDERIYLKEITPARAVAEFFTVPGVCCQFPLIQKLLDGFRNMAGELSFYRLHFRKDISFWDCIDRYPVKGKQK